jgi:hypothetical protein
VTTPQSPTETIYVRLLDEGTDVWRPTLGRRVGPMTFEVMPTPNYDPEDEKWEFLPGRVVRCGWENKSVGVALVASEPAIAPLELRARARNVVEFVGRQEPSYAPWIDTLIDGKPLEEIVAGASDLPRRKGRDQWQGSEPHELLPPKGGLLGGRGGLQLLVCAGCREPGCDPVACAIEVYDGEVVWSEFDEGNHPTRLSLVGPFVFDRKQYEAAVARAVAWDTQQDAAS